ncbi:uncharacterized protein LOC143851261 isoform X6 [Tasmannia lanceolata]|uniref:uncharacterized protein LOC143851261 isoform X6 n=1 Tax=Tasmannia lanceolata TaxID=3420 RepID=UPI004062B0C0
MGHQAIYLVGFLCVGFLFVFHRSEGSVTYVLQKLPSKPSYVLPFARRILLTITSGALPNSKEMEIKLSRMIASSTLAPQEPTEKGYVKSPSPTTKSPSPTTTSLPPIGEKTPIGYLGKSPTTNAPSPLSLPKGSILPPMSLQPKPTSAPPTIQGQVASAPSNAPSPHIIAEHKQSRVIAPSIEIQTPHAPVLSVPVQSPPRESALIPPVTLPNMPRVAPSMSSEQPAVSPILIALPIVHGKRHGSLVAPSKEIFNNSSPPNSSPSKEPVISPILMHPPIIHGKRHGMPDAAPLEEIFNHSSPPKHSPSKEPAVSPILMHPPIIHGKRHGMPVAAPLEEIFNHSSPPKHSPSKGSSPPISVMRHKAMNPTDNALAPATSFPKPPPTKMVHSPAPSISFHIHHPRQRASSPAFAPSHLFPPPSLPQEPAVSPILMHPPIIHGKRHGMPVAAPLEKIFNHSSPPKHSPSKGSSPPISAMRHKAMNPTDNALAPATSFPKPPPPKMVHSPAPSISFHIHQPRQRASSPAFAPSHLFPPPSNPQEPAVSPILMHPPIIHGKRHGMPVAAPPEEIFNHLSPPKHSPSKGSSPPISAMRHKAMNPTDNAPAPAPATPFPKPPTTKMVHSPAPSILFHIHHPRQRASSPAFVPSHLFPPPSYPQEPAVSPILMHSPIIHGKRHGMPVAAPPKEIFNHLSPPKHSPSKGSSPPISAMRHKAMNPTDNAPAPATPFPKPPTTKMVHSPAPSILFHIHHPRQRASSPAFAPSHLFPPPSYPQEPAVSPILMHPPIIHGKRHGMPVAAPLEEIFNHSSPPKHSPSKGSSPPISAMRHKAMNPTDNALAPATSFPKPPPTKMVHSPAPSISFHIHQPRQRASSPAFAPSHLFPPPSNPQEPAVSPILMHPPIIHGKRHGMPVAAPPEEIFNHLSPPKHSPSKEPAVSPILMHPPIIHGKRHGMPVAAPPEEIFNHLSPPKHSPSKGSSPPISAMRHKAMNPTDNAPAPATPFPKPPTTKMVHSPAPSIVFHIHHPRQRASSPAFAPSHLFPPPSYPQEPAVSPILMHPPIIHGKRHGMPVAAPPEEIFNHLSPPKHSPSKGSSPPISAMRHKAMNPTDNAPAPATPFPKPPTTKMVHSPAPSILFHIHHPRQRASSPAFAPSHLFPPPSYPQGPVITPAHPRETFSKRNRLRPHAPPPLVQGPLSSVLSPLSPTVNQGAPSHPPKIFPKRNRRSHGPSPLDQGPPRPIQSPSSPTMNRGATAPSPSLMVPSSSGLSRPIQSPSSPTVNRGAIAPSPSLMVPSSSGPIPSPSFSPSGSYITKPMKPVPPPVRALPPPPPSEDCTSVPCTEPLTNTAPGSPCGCVLPMQVGLRLGVALYTFFPLVSEFAQEIAAGIFMKQSQVRIMGANAASQQPDETIVLVDLVPLGEKFDNNTAFFTYEKFWHRQVAIKTNFFGDYELLYVRYPGLPSSLPLAPSNITVEDGPLSSGNNGRKIRPLGVDPGKQRERLSGSLIAITVLSSIIVLILCVGAAWLFLLKRGDHNRLPALTPRTSLPLGKPSGVGPMIFGSGPSSASLSFGSSIATYTGSAKTFSIGEIERATDNFDDSRILGEGGFGRVYSGNLEDGTMVAVKVLKRDDQQGGREFLAEVEMLSRLHHRNLVKLIGICTAEHSRCLVYELIPNGSLESHLHGVDKETALLDWGARMKIALGSARGLAYLHEDSSPRVIHRDFKSSNILLEHDFTPKVSDFGLARTALEEGNEHISTRVMGTFGYVAPEYAMTGHLLVKSDVYSYGVVLLELLTGRKPVDMSQPPGQENLVTWARPLLTSKEGLETIIDPALGPHYPFDSVAKVAAIASMCVQPEVSHRPFMGEVVQALKLVCNENEEKKEGSGSCSQEDFSITEMETRVSNPMGQFRETHTFLTADYDSGLPAERALSTSDLFSTGFARQGSGSFRRHSSSGPLRTGGNRPFWKRGLSRGSVSEHGFMRKLWAGLEREGRWP